MLRWQQDFGPKEDYWNAKIAAGRRAPEPFLNKPELDPEAEWYWVAFSDLSSERQIGMGIGPIPRSSVRAYAAELHLHEDQFDQMWAIIRQVDGEYQKLANASKPDDKPVDKKPDAPSAENRKPVTKRK